MLHQLVKLICCLLAWSIVGCFAWSVIRNLKHGVRYVKRLHQIPCHRCLYFTADYNLKCTVHPMTACTEAAHTSQKF